MSEELPWQIQIFQKSLKKKEKVRLLEGLIAPGAHQRCLEIGCAKGTISYFLRQRGGAWTHADLDEANVASAVKLLGPNVVQFGDEGLPFPDDCFDAVVVLDYLEHVDDDEFCLDEVDRVLAPGGTLYLSTPREGGVLNAIKPRIGLPLEAYGHVREGYRMEDLRSRLGTRDFRVDYEGFYAHFFTEALEMVLNGAFVLLDKLKGARKPSGSAGADKPRDGHIVPSGEAEMKKHAKQLKLYGLIYPVFRAIALLDHLVPARFGYALMLRARRST